jgi:polygalacturonase
VAYGAKGDGSTDDTTAIQNAINAANTAGGGIVYFPRGTYITSATLTVHTNVTLMGAGSNVTVISLQGSTTADCIGGTSLVNFRMSGIWLEGPGSGTGNGINLAESAGASNSYIHLTDVVVDSFGANGIQAELMIVSHFDRVVSQNNLDKGSTSTASRQGTGGRPAPSPAAGRPATPRTAGTSRTWSTRACTPAPRTATASATWSTAALV